MSSENKTKLSFLLHSNLKKWILAIRKYDQQSKLIKHFNIPNSKLTADMGETFSVLSQQIHTF